MRRRTLPRRSYKKGTRKERSPRRMDGNRKVSSINTTQAISLPSVMKELKQNPKLADSLLAIIEERFGIVAVPWLRTLYPRSEAKLRDKILAAIHKIENDHFPL